MGRAVISQSVAETQDCVPVSLSAVKDPVTALCHCFESPAIFVLSMILFPDSPSLGSAHKLANVRRK